MKILYLGNKLSAHGFTPTGVEYLGKVLESGGYNMVYASDKRNVLLRMADMIYVMFQNRDAALVLIDTYSSMAFYFAWVCGSVSRLLGIPYILILRGGNLPARAKSSPRMLLDLFRHSAKVVSVSKFLAEQFKTFFPTHYIPNTINLSLYPFRKRERVAPKLLWVRSLHEVYNPSLAIRIVARLRKDYGEACVTMVGPDKDNSRETLERLATRLGVQDHVHFTGRLGKEEWVSLSRSFDIFINTTNFDNMPVSVTEAMALGLPVVSTNVGGVPFLVEHEVSGLLVPPDDEVTFCDQIVRLIGNQQLVDFITHNARKKVEAFDNSIVLRQWKDAIHESVQPRA